MPGGFFFHEGSWVVVHAVAHFKAHTEFLGKLDRAALHYLAAAAGHFEHLIVADLGDLGGDLHDAWVAGVDTIHVGKNLAQVGFHSGSHGDGGEVAAATAQRGDVAIGGLALEACDDHYMAIIKHLMHGVRRDGGDTSLGMHAIGGDARLGTR